MPFKKIIKVLRAQKITQKARPYLDRSSQAWHEFSDKVLGYLPVDSYTEIQLTPEHGYQLTFKNKKGSLQFCPPKSRSKGQATFRITTYQKKVCLEIVSLENPRHHAALLVGLARFAVDQDIQIIKSAYKTIKALKEQTKLFSFEATHLYDLKHNELSHEEIFERAERLEKINVIVTSDVTTFARRHGWN